MKTAVKKCTAILSILVIITLTACQMIGGLNLNEIIQNAIAPSTLESRSTLTWSYEMNPRSKLDDESKRMLALFKNGSLDIISLKKQDNKTASLKAVIHLGKYTIPFEVYTTKDKASLFVGGSAKGIQLEVGDADQLLNGLYGVQTDDLVGLQDDEELTKKITSTVIRNLPNPLSTSFETGVHSTINDIDTELTVVKASVKGDELYQLVSGFLNNLLNDKEQVRSIIESFNSAIESDVDMQAGDETDMGEMSDMDVMFDSEEAADLSDAAKPVDLQQRNEDWFNAFETFTTDLKTEIDNDDNFVYKLLNNRNNTMSVSLGVDGAGKLRTVTSDVYYRVPTFMYVYDMPISSVKISYTEQRWNLDQPVTADIPPADAQYWDEQQMDRPRTFIKGLDPASDVYKLLIDELHANKIQTTLDVISVDSGEAAFDGTPFLWENSVYAGARKLANELDLDLTWSAATKLTTLSDGENELVIAANSDQATFNGKPYTLRKTTYEIEGTLYVPLAEVANLFKVKYNFQKVDSSYSYIELTKE